MKTTTKSEGVTCDRCHCFIPNQQGTSVPNAKWVQLGTTNHVLCHVCFEALCDFVSPAGRNAYRRL